MKIEFYKHNIDQKDKEEIIKVLDSLFLTTGHWTHRFEKKFSEYTSMEYTTAVSSCTNALEVALKYFGIKEGDEVITTPMSFIATANAIEYCGAKPVFVDVESKTGNIDADLIEAAVTRKTKAILPVHLYGHMCDMEEIARIAKKNNLKVVEDCAHCIEGGRNGIRPGQLADAACYSYYATKSLTCGEGGAICCHDMEMNEWFQKASQHGMSKNAADRYSKKYEHYDMEFLGFKCNMSNIQAALMIHQLDRMSDLLLKRKKIVSIYNESFQSHPGIHLPVVLQNTHHAHHLYTLWVDPVKRDKYMHLIYEKGIGVAVNYRPIHLMKYYIDKYGYKKGSFPNCEKIGCSTISIPLYPKLKEEEIEYIINTTNALIDKTD
jgi:dTDP-4-amino-4,6-dideoxygalactose transaminase